MDTIEKLLNQLKAACIDNKIPMFAVVATSDDGMTTNYDTRLLLPVEVDAELADDRISPMMLFDSDKVKVQFYNEIVSQKEMEQQFAESVNDVLDSIMSTE